MGLLERSPNASTFYKKGVHMFSMLVKYAMVILTPLVQMLVGKYLGQEAGMGAASVVGGVGGFLLHKTQPSSQK